MRKTPTELYYKDTQAAWEGINEYLLMEQNKIEEAGGGRYGPEMVSYNNFIRIDRAWIDPELDLGKVLGYKIQKWTSLVNNYVNMDEFDVIKTQVLIREKKKSNSYNISYVFDNSHSSGKGCLLSITFARRINCSYPIIIFNTRASEVTKRLIFDFLLIQRMGEYIYGEGTFMAIEFFCPNMFISAESVVMYNNHKGLVRLFRKKEKDRSLWTSYQKRVMDVLDKFTTVDPDTIKFKVHKRSVLQLQNDEDGEPISKVPSMKIKTLKLGLTELEYPEEVISPAARRKYKREQNK